MNNNDLIKKLKYSNILKSKKIEEALKKTPRELFVLDEYKDEAYCDYPLPIGEGQTISQPTTVVLMTEALDVEKNHKILEIGTGSGWQAAILSKLAKKIITIERNDKLAEFAKKNLRKLNIKNVKVIIGDGTLGYEKESPYDRIIITAATPKIPEILFKQLKEDGKIVAPVGSKSSQRIAIITKSQVKKVLNI